jgi:hypothetical protein
VEICARIWGETHEEVRSLKRYLVLFTTTVFLVAGCATAYRPVIDPLSTTDSATLEKDLSECEEIARLHMDDASSTAVKSGAASTAKAAALGAVLGALAGPSARPPGGRPPSSEEPPLPVPPLSGNTKTRTTRVCGTEATNC